MHRYPNFRRFAALFSVSAFSVFANTGFIVADELRRPEETTITLGLPVLVAQAPPDVREWGPWQFPTLQRLPDGLLQIGYHLHADSATAYGLPPGSAVSSDNGRTWQPDHTGQPPPSWTDRTLILSNGDLLHEMAERSVPYSEIKSKLPAPIADRPKAYGKSQTIYPADKMPFELLGYRFLRLKAGSNSWKMEQAAVNIPGDIRHVLRGVHDTTGGVYAFPWVQRIGLAPDGTIWGAGHTLVIGGKIVPYLGAYFLRSNDGGHVWNMQGEIPYRPDRTVDPHWKEREGFTEPFVTFLPNGSIFCLMRTTDGNGIGPLYSSRSVDGGKTWSIPRVFDRLGVWPVLLTLKDGVTLASYGRPGLFVRVSADPSASNWGTDVPVVSPGHIAQDTCSYSDMIALNDHIALIAYSDFNVPDSHGRLCKSILVRTITVNQRRSPASTGPE